MQRGQSGPRGVVDVAVPWGSRLRQPYPEGRGWPYPGGGGWPYPRARGGRAKCCQVYVTFGSCNKRLLEPIKERDANENEKRKQE